MGGIRRDENTPDMLDFTTNKHKEAEGRIKQSQRDKGTNIIYGHGFAWRQRSDVRKQRKK